MPDFTNEEKYLISSIKSRGGASYMWCYLISGIVIAGISAYYESIIGMASAFLVVCGFRVYEDRLQAKSMPAFRSIIEKYENAVGNKNDGKSTE